MIMVIFENIHGFNISGLLILLVNVPITMTHNRRSGKKCSTPFMLYKSK